VSASQRLAAGCPQGGGNGDDFKGDPVLKVSGY